MSDCVFSARKFGITTRSEEIQQEVRHLRSEQGDLKKKLGIVQKAAMEDKKNHNEKMLKKENVHKKEMRKAEEKFNVERKKWREEQFKLKAQAQSTIKSMQKKQDDLQQEVIRMKNEQIKFWKDQARNLQALAGLVPIIQTVLARK